MKTIVSRPYRLLSDHMAVYRFMLETYREGWTCGAPAPFLEYALSSDWMDLSQTHRSRLWFDGDRIVGFCYTESPVTDIYFNLLPEYDYLAGEMIAHADTRMPGADGTRRLILFTGQDALIGEAKKRGYARTGGFTDMIFDCESELNFPLPEGFSVVPPEEMSVEKCVECCWKGFDHEAEDGPWDGDAEGGYHLMQAPHATPQYAVAIQNERGEYVCYAGMWWTPENKLAYMEPLCTVPAYRGRGLAAAALAEMCRRVRTLGARVMTGGANPFYAKIGYKPAHEWNFFTRAKR